MFAATNQFITNIDLLVLAAYVLVLCLVGWWAGKKEKVKSDDYFLAGRSLPWYVVGTSQVASNISAPEIVGAIGGAFLYGICIAVWSWGNIMSFSLLIWLFIPFLLASRVFTIPQFLEKRFNPSMRLFFAIVTILANVTTFLAAVLYIGGLTLREVMGMKVEASSFMGLSMDWNLLIGIIVIAFFSGIWAIYGGLRSVAWTDFLTLVFIIAGIIGISYFGLKSLSGDANSLLEGWNIMLERNEAQTGVWKEVVEQHAESVAGPGHTSYNRLSVVQPLTHKVIPWPQLILITFTISIWYNVINQFIIQRILGAKSQWDARMGMVLAGYLKIVLPFLIVVPGLILFATHPQLLKGEFSTLGPIADGAYLTLVKQYLPVGLVGLFLAALFGAIQSTVNSVLNSTSTIFTIDIVKEHIKPDISEKAQIRCGIISSAGFLLLAVVIAYGMFYFSDADIFVYVQSLYSFFAPPFAAVFLLGILWRRINGKGALWAVSLGFVLGIALKVCVGMGVFDNNFFPWLNSFLNQAAVNWAFCMLVCLVVSLMTEPPPAEKVADNLTINWRKLNIFDGVSGSKWYHNILLWWGIFVVIIIALVIRFW
ncbi:Na+/glucose cotransporter [Lentisphaera araneosa HTCC2155]|uniref:Na+/glucose cotransporter n=1 Tax=Lentisphaera araneosa HTCC2155 TaxID=313628 RepID=A6DKU0_9BACT|nr:sodium/solute symporter [Lentisphaera araneosa]EDM27988.1 Na+/glucose cotransporter [Lentisphaera araneosa HTCC2155]